MRRASFSTKGVSSSAASRRNLCVAPPPGTSPIATSGWPKIALPTAAKHIVHGQRDLTPSASAPSLDFGDDYLGHVPQSLAARLRKTKAARMRNHLGGGSSPSQTGMGDEEIRKRALQRHHSDALIDLELSPELVRS
jgi:hypothetical protein